MTEHKKVFIFFGSAGSGKGTQVKLLKDYLTEKDPSREILHYDAGAGFRELIENEDTFVKKLVRKTMIDEGGHLPRFMPVWNWGRRFIYEVKEDMNIIIDGSPRKIEEMNMINPALDWMGYEEIYVIYLNVPNDVVVKRLLERGRGDDEGEKIKHRLAWFETEIKPVIDVYKSDSKYKYLDINGDQSVEDVQKEIVGKLGF